MRLELPHVPQGPLVALEPLFKGSTLDQLGPEVDVHLVPAQCLELIFTLVRVPKLLPEALPQLLKGLRRSKVVRHPRSLLRGATARLRH